MHNRVLRILQDTAENLVLPSFRALRPEDIAAKDTPGDPHDIVTVTDKAAERHLVQGLTGIVPNAVFIGEEAVCEDPTLVEALAAEVPAWLIDPIDGTKNFASGSPEFGIMLALVEAGSISASWIVLPAQGDLIWAERGRGTWLNGRLVTRRVSRTPRGTVHDRFMPRDLAGCLHEALRDRFEPSPSPGSAATEYAQILRGEKDFAIYYRLHPWDQAPGALALVEAGGAAVHLDGSPYTPRSADQVTIFSGSVELAATIRAWLL